jgi:hypothetical protein
MEPYFEHNFALQDFIQKLSIRASHLGFLACLQRSSKSRAGYFAGCSSAAIMSGPPRMAISLTDCETENPMETNRAQIIIIQKIALNFIRHSHPLNSFAYTLRIGF